MFNRINFRWLIAIFLLLLLVSIVVIILNRSEGATSRNRTFVSELTRIDTATVTYISITPRSGNESIELIKKDQVWKVKVDDKNYNADPSAVKGMLVSLSSLRATRIAARNKDQWAKYEVTDSAATHVIANAGKKTVADIYLGKFSYQQPKNANPYMYQQQGKMTSYVRLTGDKQVYAVDGMIAISFNRNAEDFRNRTLIKSNKENWNRLVFSLPDNSYSMIKQDNKWMVDGMLADSAAVKSYLSSLAWLNSSNFIEDRILATDIPAYSLSIEGENILTPIKIRAYPADSLNRYVITSSLNEGSYFSGSKNGLFDKIFKEKNSFLVTQAESNTE